MIIALVVLTLAAFVCVAIAANLRVVGGVTAAALCGLGWGFYDLSKPCVGDAAGCGMGEGMAGLMLTGQAALLGVALLSALIWRLVFGKAAGLLPRIALAGGIFALAGLSVALLL